MGRRKAAAFTAAAVEKRPKPVIRMDLPEFKPGDQVRHEAFGNGTVVSYQKKQNDAEVVVAFDGAGVKRFLVSFAKIEKA